MRNISEYFFARPQGKKCVFYPNRNCSPFSNAQNGYGWRFTTQSCGRTRRQHKRALTWDIKSATLPAVAPDLSYDQLDGVHDGGMAMEAFREALSPKTNEARKAQIEQQLTDYCRLDTYAMVRLWQFFSNRKDLEI